MPWRRWSQSRTLSVQIVRTKFYFSDLGVVTIRSPSLSTNWRYESPERITALPFIKGDEMLWQFEDCTLNTQTRMLWKRGSLLRLQPKVMDLLIVLIQNHSRYVSKHELFEMLWTGVRVGNASLLRLVRELRRALDDDGGNPRLIRTLHSRGYQFIGAVRELTELTEACV